MNAQVAPDPADDLTVAAVPAISVIVCAYNYERWLPTALDSALAQDHPSFEVIVVDDGSTDGTPDVIAAYGDRVRGVRRPNGGLNAATTTGMGAARGRYLTFLDADDFWPQGRLTALSRVLDAHPEVGLVYGDMDIRRRDGRQVALSFRAATGVCALSGRILGPLLATNVVSAGALMVRSSLRELFHPIPPHASHQDWWIAARVSTVAEVLAIPEVVNHYRLHDANMNLGVAGERQLRLWAGELPFRRWLLQTADPALVGPADALAGLRFLDAMIAKVRAADAAGDALSADRTAAVVAVEAASAALDDGDLSAACVHLVRAAGFDVDWIEPRLLLRELIPHVPELAAALAA